MTVVICFIAVQIIMFFFLYPLLVAGKWEDEQMQRLFEEKRAAEGRKELEDKMESQRDVLRMIEKEISKGSVPVRFAGMGFTEDTYHLVESKAKMNQLLDYFFRIGEFAALADKQVRSNVYMDAGFKKVNFRSAISELDRRNMEAAAKRWMKKKHPSFDGDVYVENVRCFLEFPEEEKEKYECTVNGEKTTALIFSRKHLSGLYLQCLIYRKEAMQHMEQLEGLSEVCNRIYRLEDVDVLFQCMLFDQMEWEDGKVYGHFSTVYLLKNRE